VKRSSAGANIIAPTSNASAQKGIALYQSAMAEENGGRTFRVAV